jgi:hypothetical protein
MLVTSFGEPLALLSTNCTVEVKGFLAQVILIHVFQNTSNNAEACTFQFPMDCNGQCARVATRQRREQ